MTAYYLKENFPGKKIYLFENFQNKKKLLSHDDFTKNDIFIITPDCKIDPKIKIDFFINARSMMEMNFDVIKLYFKFIEQFSHKNSFFLNINRYEKTSVGEPIRIADYPYDNNCGQLSLNLASIKIDTFFINKEKFLMKVKATLRKSLINKKDR